MKVQYIFRAFGQPREVWADNVPAHFLKDDCVLYYGADDEVPWPAIARELAGVIGSDVEPARIAMAINEVLAASSLKSATSALDQFGVPELDTSAVEIVVPPSVTTGIGGDTDLAGP